MIDPHYQTLFSYAEHMTPYLKGEVCNEVEHDMTYLIKNNGNNQDKLYSIYQQLQQSYPEAGHAYWLTRTWELLTWQPIYISLISIYQLKSLPPMHSFSQSLQHLDQNFIAGFQLNGEEFVYAEPEALIIQTATQLKPLFEQYRQELDASVRLRPGFVDQLLADGLVVALLRLQEVHTDLPKAYIPHHANLWLQAFGLSNKTLNSLKYSIEGSSWSFTRTSCCMAYRTETGSLCSNCPRLQKMAEKDGKNRLRRVLKNT